MKVSGIDGLRKVSVIAQTSTFNLRKSVSRSEHAFLFVEQIFFKERTLSNAITGKLWGRGCGLCSSQFMRHGLSPQSTLLIMRSFIFIKVGQSPL